MKSINKIAQLSLLMLLLLGANACQQPGGESTGSEFIPDMAHSVAYEANVYSNYSLNSWDEESVASRRSLSMPRNPVAGTIARGYAGAASNDGTFANASEAVSYAMSRLKNDQGHNPNGAVPYYYPDTEEGRQLAIEQIKYNPFPISQRGIAQGQELYGYYCGVCHGEKGDGAGYLVRDGGGKYPAQPANFLLDEFVNASNGRYYHSIMYGKNAMGAYADKLSYEERWNVIHYIRSLQAKKLKVKYDSESNQFNPDFGVPEAKALVVAPVQTLVVEDTSSTQSGDHSHGHGGGHDH